jgi:hypothetical protein
MAQVGEGSLNNWFIPAHYTPRPRPDYFADVRPDGKHWQPDVIPIAAHLARVARVRRLVDIGCGRADGLAPYAPEFALTGVDYGSNIAYCKGHHPGDWHSCDLETEVPDIDFKQSVVICADVIEHLVDPTALLATLTAAALEACAVVISTPDRNRVYGHPEANAGPPGNPHHVREWALGELVALAQHLQWPVQWYGWTRSNDVDAYKHTSILVVSRYPIIVETVKTLDALFPLERSN